VLVNGIEPNLRWRSFCAELLGHVERLGVTKVITLGALLTDTPHTRPTPVTGTSYDTSSAAELRVEPTSYQGPTGIVGVFQNACVEAGIPAVSFWASVPHYVSQARVPKAAVALLHRIEEVLDVEVPLGALPEQAEEWERTVSEMAEADDEVREYVRQLEEQAEAATDGDGAKAISITTWVLFLISNATAMAYALVNQADWMMAAMFLANAVGCSAIILVGAWKRSQHRCRLAAQRA